MKTYKEIYYRLIFTVVLFEEKSCENILRLAVLDFLSILSDLLLTRETGTKKKMSNFAKLQLLNDKIDQNTNFAKLASAKCFYVSFSG